MAIRQSATLVGYPTPALVEALVEVSADPIFVVDPEGRMVFANHAALSLFGYERLEDVLGLPSHETFHYKRPDGSPFPVEQCPLLASRTRGDAVRVEEDWLVRRDGSMVPVSYSCAPVEMGHGRAAVVTCRDIGERLRTEEALRARAVERARLDELRAASARIADATAAEHRRVVRDLHDGAQQRLVYTVIALQTAQHARSDDRGRADDLADEALRYAQSALSELRELAQGILPSLLTDRGLCAAVEELAGRASIPMVVTAPESRFPPALEAAGYFLVAEALTNMAKHARAGAGAIEIRDREGHLYIEVRDDGVGGASSRHGRGLRGLRDRVAALGGDIEIESPPGKGTRLRAAFPLRPPHEAARALAGELERAL